MGLVETGQGQAQQLPSLIVSIDSKKTAFGALAVLLAEPELLRGTIAALMRSNQLLVELNHLRAWSLGRVKRVSRLMEVGAWMKMGLY